MRKFKISWGELEKLLQKQEQLIPGEKIQEITLMKPKEILILATERES